MIDDIGGDNIMMESFLVHACSKTIIHNSTNIKMKDKMKHDCIRVQLLEVKHFYNLKKRPLPS